MDMRTDFKYLDRWGRYPERPPQEPGAYWVSSEIPLANWTGFLTLHWDGKKWLRKDRCGELFRSTFRVHFYRPVPTPEEFYQEQEELKGIRKRLAQERAKKAKKKKT